MPMSFSSKTLDELVTGLEATSEWFESLGIAVGGSRLEAIRDRLTELEVIFRDGGDAALRRSWNNLDTALVLADTLAFTSISSQFRQLKPDLIPRRHLRTVLDGPLMVQDENPSTGAVNARNIFFELELAADLMSRGIVLDGFDDIRFSFAGRAIRIECKRLHSEKRVEENIATAFTQLRTKMAETGEYGIVALALERLTAMDRAIQPIYSDYEIKERVEDLLAQFLHRHPTCFDSPVDTRVIAILVVFRLIVDSKSRGILGRAFASPLVPLVEREHLQAAEADFIRDLSRFLSSKTDSRARQ